MKIFNAFLISFLISSNSYNSDWCYKDKPSAKKERYQIKVYFFEGDRPHGSKKRNDMYLFLNQGYSSFDDIKAAILKKLPKLIDYTLRIQAEFEWYEDRQRWTEIKDIHLHTFSDLVENPTFHIYFSKEEPKQENKSSQSDDEWELVQKN